MENNSFNSGDKVEITYGAYKGYIGEILWFSVISGMYIVKTEYIHPHIKPYVELALKSEEMIKIGA